MRKPQRWCASGALVVRVGTGQIAGMDGSTEQEPGDRTTGLPTWAWIGGGGLLLLTALAAPFYGQAMGALMWAGATIRALCGW